MLKKAILSFQQIWLPQIHGKGLNNPRVLKIMQMLCGTNTNKAHSWWKNNLIGIWSFGFPFKQGGIHIDMLIGCASQWFESSN